MLTLQSFGVRTPDAVEGGKETELGSVAPAGETPVERLDGNRPPVERFYTAALGVGAGAGLFSSGIVPDDAGEKNEVENERPGVERFETAKEDLRTMEGGKVE